MPVEAKKKLYIGKTLSDLNKQIEKDVDKKYPKRLTGLSSKMLSAADLAYKSLDEERAYILFMRYVFIWKVLRGSAEYKNNSNYYNDLFGTKNIKRAIDRAAELSDSLEHRYQDSKEEEELKGKLAKEAEEATVNGDADVALQNGNEIPEEKTLGTNGCLQAKDLYDVIVDKDFSVLVMDVRSSDQYSSSQIKDIPSVNVPMDIIKAGATVVTIQKGLPADSRPEWNRRGDYDYVILLDWDSTVGGTKHGSTLASLKDALYKWDSSRVLKHEPLILEGGYADWILRYPMYSTNSRVTKPPSYESLMKPKGSLDFDYPDLDDKPPAPPQNQEPDTPVLQATQSEQIPPPTSSIPSVNRTLKPQTNSIQPSLPNGGLKIPAVSKGGGSIQENGQSRSVGGSMPTTVTSPPLEQTRQVTPAAPVKQHNGDIHSDLTRPQMPTFDRSSKPQKVVDVKGSTTDVPDSNDGPEETTESVPSPEERLQEEKEEQAEVADRQELERLKLKEEEVRGQLDKMRTEKTRLENSELKKENQALEEKIKEHQEEMTRLKTEMESHKARLDSKPIPKTEKVTSKSVSGSSPTKANTSASPTKANTSDGGGKLNNLQPSNQSSNGSDKSKPNNVKPADKTTVNLPSGWEMKWDDNKQRYFYIDHGTKTSHWELPANVKGGAPPSGGEQVLKPAVGKEQPKPDSLKLAKPAASTSPEKHSKGTTRIPLKSESAEFPGQTTLKRSFSSPNIAKMVVDEEQSRKIPAFDRGQKPANRPTSAQSYNQHQLVVRKRNLDPVYGSQARALTGLRNLGNTCFMNSVVQCLSNTSLLTKYFLEDTYVNDINQKNPLGRKGEVATEFAVVVKALWAGQYKSIAPRDLLRTVIKYVPEFNQKIGHHHDSQEFLVFLMDGLHEDLNQVLQRQYVKEEDFSSLDLHVGSQLSWKNHLMLNRSIIVGLFQGQFRSVVTCLHCKNESVKYEAFMFLELPIPSRTKCTLQECIEKFQSEEKLAGDNATLCSKCKRLRDSVKYIQICKLPTILIIHLKRFYFEGMWRQKLQTNIDYPVTSLDMRRFTSQKAKTENGVYNLYAVSNHTGTLDGGHYTAYCKSAVNQRWYKYDDTDVYEYSVGKIRSSGAYILFYTAVQLREP